jgi:hypothetical protein
MSVPRAVKAARRAAVERYLQDERVVLPFSMCCWIGAVVAVTYAVALVCYSLGHLTLWALGW